MVVRKMYFDDPNLGEIEKEYLCRCIDSTFVSTYGPYVEEFEKKFSVFLCRGRCVALQSGTAGLHMALRELGIGESDEVIVPVLTFIATVNPVKYLGATPVFVDVDPQTWNMDPVALERAITVKTKAIIPVHLFGNPCEMDRIMNIAKKHNLRVVEDATESIGSRYDGHFTGTFGDFGVFSFNGNKVITTGGGGMVAGKDTERVKHIKFLINQARADGPGYYHTEIGFNYRMTNLEASLGLAQLERLEGFLEKKRKFRIIYQEIFENSKSVCMQSSYEKSDPFFWLNCVNIKNGSLDIHQLQKELKRRGVPTKRIFMPIVEFPPYENSGTDFKNAYEIFNNSFCLPSSTLNDEENIEKAARIVLEILGE